jgi:hypothetical protein
MSVNCLYCQSEKSRIVSVPLNMVVISSKKDDDYDSFEPALFCDSHRPEIVDGACRVKKLEKVSL